MDRWVGARLIWRQRFTYLQQWIAKTNEYRLYVLLLMQPITGLGDVVFHGRPFTLFIWQVPALFAPDAAIRSLFREVMNSVPKRSSRSSACTRAPALFHGLVLRDGVRNGCCRCPSGLAFCPRAPTPVAVCSLVRFGVKSPCE